MKAAERPSDDWSPAALSQSQGFRHLALTAATFFLVSFWLHFPGMYANVYSDLMDTLWQRIIHATGIIPYVSYKLEYPGVSAAVLYASSLWGDMYAFYLSMSLILFACMLGTLFIVHRSLRERGQPVQAIAYFIVFTPSFIYFSIYSFDWIGAVLMVASIYLAYKRRAFRSGVFIGLAAAARIIPIVCLPFILLEFKSKKNRLLLLGSAGAAWLAANTYFILTDLPGFLYPYQFQAGMGVEDSWLGLASPFAKELSIVTLGAALGLILLWRERFNLFQQTLLAMLAFVICSFKFPPQYMILLLPLFALTGVGYREFMIANVLNVVLILWWFTPAFNLGNALSVSSPVQLIAYGRQFLLYLVFVRLLARGRKAGVLPVEGEVQLEPQIPVVVPALQRTPEESDPVATPGSLV